MINKVTLIGNVGNDPEMKMLEGCTAVARVSLATQDSYKDKAGEWQQQTEWHNVIMWRDLAERAEKQIKKGSKIYVEGKITYRKYKDKDGIDRQVTDIVASTFRTLDKKEASDTGTYEQAKFPDTSQAPAVQTPGTMDDLPF